MNALGSSIVIGNQNELNFGFELGQVLSDPNCHIQILKLSWNRIRDKSAEAIALALKKNQSLVYLDLR